MKIKKSSIVGLALTVMLLSSLFIGAAPVSAGTVAWSTVSSPGLSGEVLEVNIDVDFLVMSEDGATMFSYDNTGQLLRKSTNSGKTWTTTNIGDNLEGNTVTAMAISPDYATDRTLFAVTGLPTTGFHVYRSADEGDSGRT